MNTCNDSSNKADMQIFYTKYTKPSILRYADYNYNAINIKF